MIGHANVPRLPLAFHYAQKWPCKIVSWTLCFVDDCRGEERSEKEAKNHSGMPLYLCVHCLEIVMMMINFLGSNADA